MNRESADAGESVVRSWSRDWRYALPVRAGDEQTRLVEAARRAVVELQAAARTGGAAGRALHRRAIHETTVAALTVSTTLPDLLHLGPFAPGTTWAVAVRLTSAFPTARSDDVPDQRGLAVRISDEARRLYLLATTGEAHHARDAEAMIVSLQAAALVVRGGMAARLSGLASLVRGLGLRDGVRMARTITRAAEAGVSLAALSYYSRAPFQLGPFAVRYRFRAPDDIDRAPRATGEEALAHDIVKRLQTGPVAWDFQLQGYLDPVRTPMNDHRVPWDSPWLTIARLTLAPPPPPAPLRAARASVEPPVGDGSVGSIGFRSTPEWPDPRGAVLEPLGDLNALRAAAYAASEAGRSSAGEPSSAHLMTPSRP